jgi:hypothetical protein
MCSKICEGGIQKRFRFCNNPEPDFGGITCEGAIFEEFFCNLFNCSEGKKIFCYNSVIFKRSHCLNNHYFLLKMYNHV